MAVVLIYGLYLAIPLPGEKLARDYSQVILARDGSFLRVYLNSQEQWCLPPQLQTEIPDKLKTAVLTYEDQYFDRHWGVNPVAVVRAAYLNVKHQRVVSGGSTLTMQLARMILAQPRTLYNKFREVFLAMKIEAHYSKREILQEYLSHAPYGSNVRGYLAASYRFFGKEPKQLTWGEAATLAVLPNAPGMIFPSKNSDKLERKRNQLLKRMYELEIIDEETYELTLLERTPDEMLPFPLAAPHLTDRIHATHHRDIVETTIDTEIQYETNFFVQQHAAKMKEMGIRNACALVVDNRTGHVVSYVGSQDYHNLDQDEQGRVDGVVATRSSGSILKPFLYAAAIDEGIVLPQTLIKDVPTYFESFSPSNASETFQGVVPASTALIHSLNVPAVRLLNAYGVQKFYNMLEAAGVQSLFRHADDYGLPLILGGAEVSPWDMAQLYRGLAQGGRFARITYDPSEVLEPEQELVSEAATFLVLDELKELIRPGLEFYWKKYGDQRPLAWKTGTSYGHKDAWAVGTSPWWTVVVWVGNFDGESNKNLSGMASAGPLLFNIANILPEDSKELWFEEKAEDFVMVRICEETGFYVSSACPNTMEVKAPVHMRPMKVCPYHQRFFIDPSTGYAVCSRCWDGHQAAAGVLKFTPDINYYLRKNGVIVTEEPIHNPACRQLQEHGILQITYPVDRANIFLPKDFDGSHQPLIGRVATQFPDREMFWYVDDSFVSSSVSNPSMPLYLREGPHVLTVVDAEGNRDQVRFSVSRN
ncbi:penicillin-binding protein 1C [Reichenbachiella sp. 5M10]|nr:penicillin-binding protein 1C [Reichenbachiella sp. 5M10]